MLMPVSFITAVTRALEHMSTHTFTRVCVQTRALPTIYMSIIHVTQMFGMLLAATGHRNHRTKTLTWQHPAAYEQESKQDQ